MLINYKSIKAIRIARNIYQNFEFDKEYTQKEYQELRTSIMSKKITRRDLWFSKSRQESFSMTRTMYFIEPTQEEIDRFNQLLERWPGGYTPKFFDMWDIKDGKIQSRWTSSSKIAHNENYCTIKETEQKTFTAYRYFYKVNEERVRQYIENSQNIPDSMINDYLYYRLIETQVRRQKQRIENQMWKKVIDSMSTM